MPPDLWWSPSQGLILAEHRRNGETVLIRIMTSDYSRPGGGRVFAEMPVDAHPMLVRELPALLD